MTRFIIVFVAGFLLSTGTAYASSTGGFGIGLEPVVGYERVQKLVPTAHTSDRLVYGARLTLGVPLLSVEAEYLRGTDTEAFPSNDLTTIDTDDKIKVGLRSRLALGSLLSFTLRAGGQANFSARNF